MNIQYVYVAGPISKGDQFENVKKAIDVAESLLIRGFTPFVPHVCVFWNFYSPRPKSDWLKYDYSWILRCDAVFRMEGESEGADMEVAFAKSKCIPVYYNINEITLARSIVDGPAS